LDRCRGGLFGLARYFAIRRVCFVCRDSASSLYRGFASFSFWCPLSREFTKFGNFQDEVELGPSTGSNRQSIDASGLEQRSSSLVGTATVDSGLGVALAGVVSGRYDPEI
jgi:hypothetical protein